MCLFSDIIFSHRYTNGAKCIAVCCGIIWGHQKSPTPMGSTPACPRNAPHRHHPTGSCASVMARVCTIPCAPPRRRRRIPSDRGGGRKDGWNHGLNPSCPMSEVPPFFLPTKSGFGHSSHYPRRTWVRTTAVSHCLNEQHTRAVCCPWDEIWVFDISAVLKFCIYLLHAPNFPFGVFLFDCSLS